jgi:HNH endonuclease
VPVTAEYAWLAEIGVQQPLMELAARDVAGEVDAVMWRAWLADRDTRGRHEALVYRRGPGQCAYWLGAISSTGHGKFRVGSRARARPQAGPSRIVTAHVYAYQLHHGVLPAAGAGQIVIRHQCDETSCQNWEHLITGSQPDNVRDYLARRGREGGPLADSRGARGRAVAIRAAILTARRTGADIEDAIQRAISAGNTPRQERLF